MDNKNFDSESLLNKLKGEEQVKKEKELNKKATEADDLEEELRKLEELSKMLDEGEDIDIDNLDDFLEADVDSLVEDKEESIVEDEKEPKPIGFTYEEPIKKQEEAPKSILRGFDDEDNELHIKEPLMGRKAKPEPTNSFHDEDNGFNTFDDIESGFSIDDLHIDELANLSLEELEALERLEAEEEVGFDEWSNDIDDIADFEDPLFKKQENKKGKSKRKKPKTPKAPKEKNKSGIGKKIAIGLVSVLILSGIGFGIFKFVSSKSKPKTPETEAVENQDDNKVNLEDINNAEELKGKGVIKDLSEEEAVIDFEDHLTLFEINSDIYNEIFDKVNQGEIYFYYVLQGEDGEERYIMTKLRDKEDEDDTSNVIEIEDDVIEIEIEDEEEVETPEVEETEVIDGNNVIEGETETIKLKKDTTASENLWFQLSWRPNASNSKVLRKEEVKLSLISPSGTTIEANEDNFFIDEDSLNFYIVNGEAGTWTFNIEKSKAGSLGDIASNIVSVKTKPKIEKASIKQTGNKINVLWTIKDIEHIEVQLILKNNEKEYVLDKFDSVSDGITLSDNKDFTIPKNLVGGEYEVIFKARELDVRKDGIGKDYIYRKLISDSYKNKMTVEN